MVVNKPLVNPHIVEGIADLRGRGLSVVSSWLLLLLLLVLLLSYVSYIRKCDWSCTRDLLVQLPFIAKLVHKYGSDRRFARIMVENGL